MEDLLASAVIVLIGVATVAFGMVAASQRIDLAMMHHTRENTEAGAWARCHRFVGRGFSIVGGVWIASGALIPVVDDRVGEVLFIAVILLGALAMLGFAFGGLAILDNAEPDSSTAS